MLYYALKPQWNLVDTDTKGTQKCLHYVKKRNTWSAGQLSHTIIVLLL